MHVAANTTIVMGYVDFSSLSSCSHYHYLLQNMHEISHACSLHKVTVFKDGGDQLASFELSKMSNGSALHTEMGKKATVAFALFKDRSLNLLILSRVCQFRHSN